MVSEGPSFLIEVIRVSRAIQLGNLAQQLLLPRAFIPAQVGPPTFEELTGVASHRLPKVNRASVQPQIGEEAPELPFHQIAKPRHLEPPGLKEEPRFPKYGVLTTTKQK